MRSQISIFVGLLLLILSCGLAIRANPSPTPTPIKKVIVPTGVPTQPGGGATSGRRSAAQPGPGQAAAATNLRPVMSIEDVKFDQPPMIKVLVMNRGKQKNKPNEFATVRYELWAGDKNNVQSIGLGQMEFWVTGKPQPHSGVWFGKALTQQQVDAMPATTKIRSAFQKVVSIPPLAPGESEWLSVDFTLPDPGTFARPFPPGDPVLATLYKNAYTLPTGDPVGYIDASRIDECINLKAFFASYTRIQISAEFRRVQAGDSYVGQPPVDGPVTPSLGRQLPQAYLKYMNMPANKYTGKCK